MVSFARARTRSWVSKLWPLQIKTRNNATSDLSASKELVDKQNEQNKFFLEATKNGGIWFS